MLNGTCIYFKCASLSSISWYWDFLCCPHLSAEILFIFHFHCCNVMSCFALKCLWVFAFLKALHSTKCFLKYSNQQYRKIYKRIQCYYWTFYNICNFKLQTVSLQVTHVAHSDIAFLSDIYIQLTRQNVLGGNEYVSILGITIKCWAHTVSIDLGMIQDHQFTS